MYFHNSDGSLTKAYYNGEESPPRTPVAFEENPQLPTPIATSTGTLTEHKENKNNHVEGYHLFKRHRNCNCMNCWKNFVLMTIFYAVIIYLLYLLITSFFSKNEQNVVNAEITKVV